MMKLLEDILVDDKFKGIPKMVVTQFCRGQSMLSTMAAVTDDTLTETSDLSKHVNGQEFYSKKVSRHFSKHYAY